MEIIVSSCGFLRRALSYCMYPKEAHLLTELQQLKKLGTGFRRAGTLYSYYLHPIPNFINL